MTTASVDRPEQPSAPPSVWAEARKLLSLALPIVISLAAATLIGVVDTIMIAPLGTQALAAASVTSSIIMISYSGLYGFVSVIGVRMAAAYGQANDEQLTIATRTGVVIATVMGLIGASLMVAVKPTLG